MLYRSAVIRLFWYDVCVRQRSVDEGVGSRVVEADLKAEARFLSELPATQGGNHAFPWRSFGIRDLFKKAQGTGLVKSGL